MSGDSKISEKKSLKLSDYYLILYNVILTVGWSLILYVTVQTGLTWKTQNDVLTSKNLYKNNEFLLQIFQTAALLEVVHAAIGIVRSNPVLVFVQVLSRITVVWFVAYPFESPRSSVGILVVCTAWSFAEIIRYVYYALNIIGKIPYFITWCRYSFFIALYPIGVTGELICMYYAAKYLEPLNIRKRYSFLLPNNLNISFDIYYFFILTMLLYIPVFPILYKHMLAQREKILNGPSKKAKKQE
ncbi:unnamed protein product [Brachionus calyciflorus]|uniref:Very-long-chain (3R)-3-hydroxyacyl-CoA dehydratase n=1 Tax=Brachionus calyciflorus TaxID=104777 RepID=A0A813PSC9_9BILA|nr:unnamed protein product [Brachionus calyciflorus]